MFDLKECPFCGGDEAELSVGEPDSDGTPCAINCNECGAHGPMVIVDSEATPLAMLSEAGEEWNERA